MKYVVILGDGMADEPVAELGEMTPLQYARTPMLDELAGMSELGLVHTIPAGMSPGSDTANLSVMGYDPRKYYTGRSPLEALSIGVDMKDDDVALRCNLVTLSKAGEYRQKQMIDHSSGEISTADARTLLEAVIPSLQDEVYQFHVGTSYRHCLIWKQGSVAKLTPPHDILEQEIGKYLPADRKLLEMQQQSYQILSQHPLNLKRQADGLNPANSLWFWGAGTKPALASFKDKFGKQGAMISAVDLLKGIAVGAGLDNKQVAGANGGLHTNYEGKAQAAVTALTKECYDFAYVHVEAPDEMGHQGNVWNKIEAIEKLDSRVIRIVKEGLDHAREDYRMLILPDHPTPVRLRTHTSAPVPYLLYDSSDKKNRSWRYNEQEAKAGGNEILHGHELMNYLFSK